MTLIRLREAYKIWIENTKKRLTYSAWHNRLKTYFKHLIYVKRNTRHSYFIDINDVMKFTYDEVFLKDLQF